MRVEVRLFATLAGLRPSTQAGLPFEFTVRDETTVADLIARLALPSDLVHLVMINGRVVEDRNTLLHEDDRIGLFPPVGGG